jgi:hypothetical protein
MDAVYYLPAKRGFNRFGWKNPHNSEKRKFGIDAES